MLGFMGLVHVYPLTSCSDSLPGNMAAGHGVAPPVRKLGPRALPRGEGRWPAPVTHATSGRSPPHFPSKTGSASKATSCIPSQPA